MKKLTLIATAVLGLVSTTAMAQSTVTIYGILDGGFTSISGLRNGNYTGVVSGIMDGSRFGLRGAEDIGGGYRAIFTLENRLELDTGSVTNRPPSGAQLPDRFVNANLLVPTFSAAQQAGLQPLFTGIAAAVGAGLGVNIAGNLFDRQAFAGLVTPFGAFTLGRQYTPGYLVGATFDASQTQSSLAAGQVASFPGAFDIRLSNTIQYGIQANGFTATAMYGAGEVAGDSAKSRFLGGMVIYKGAGFSAGFGHNERKNSLAQKSLTNNIVGGSIDVGPGTIYSQYATVKDENPETLVAITPTIAGNAVALTAAGTSVAAITQAYSNALQQDGRLFHIGYKMTSGPHTGVIAYNRYDDKRPNNADVSSYGFTYTYALSKRTSLNGVVTRFDNKGLGQAAPGQAGFLGGVTSNAGVGSTSLALGINHKF